MSSELDILISDREIKLRDDQVITLRPCKVLQLRKILGLVNKYVDQIAQNEDEIELTKFLLQDSGEQGLSDVFTVLKSCSQIDKSEAKSDDEFFDNLYYDELALLGTKFLEMNKDFFASLGKSLSKAVLKDTPIRVQAAPHINPEPQPSKTGASTSAA